MMRKAAALVTAICCLVASQVYALGLGPLTLESSLNQPLRARIEIVDLGGVSPADIVVQMGSQQDFRRFNLERVNFFSDVDFTIESTAQGTFVVLSSNQSVREPYLSFILDTRWPSGRILSEHTLLLDLPVFSDGRSIAEPINQPVSPVVDSETTVQQQAAADAGPEVTDEQDTQASTPESTRATESVVRQPSTAAGSLEVQDTDTLWEVAMRVRPDDSVTIQQTMLAIQRLNPDAFFDGNINRLRAGETLRIPDLSQIQSISQQQAVSEVTRQNQQADLNVQPLTAPATGPSSLAASEQQGQLRVLTAEEAQPAGTGASATIEAENAELDARIQALENQLALQEEDADRSRLQQAELVSRLNDLDGQIAAAMEIISLQDQQLAQLQQSLAEAAVQASLQQEAVATQPAAVAQQSQPVSTTPPSFLNSIATVLNNNSMILIIVSVLVVLLMVMLLFRRNRVATTEGLEVEFEGDLASPQESSDLVNDRRRGFIEPGEEAAMAVAGIAGSAVGEENEETVVAENLEETAAESESGVDETAFESSFDQQTESDIDIYDLAEESEEPGHDEHSFADDVKEFQDQEATGSEFVTEELEEEELATAEITGIETPEESEQLHVEEAQAEEEAELDEIVDFELDTEVDAEQEDDQSADVVDFDIDEFLDEDEEVEAESIEGQAEAAEESADSDQGIDFELDTEVDEDEAEEDEEAGIDLGEVEFSAESDEDSVEQIDVESEADSETDSDLDLDTFALEDEESADSSGSDTETDDEVETLDFDLGDSSIDGLDEEGVDLESASDAEVETLDFELDTESEIEESPDDVELEVEEADDFEAVDFAPEKESEESETEVTSVTESESESESEPEDTVSESADELAEEAEPETEVAAEVSGDLDSKAETEEDTEEAIDEQVEFAAEQGPVVADEAEADEESEDAGEEAVAEAELELEAEADEQDEEAAEASEEDRELAAASETAEAEEVAEIELVNEAPDEDEIGEVVAQNEEAATAESEVELSELDFLATENESTVDGAEQDTDLLSDDDEAATKLDLAYAYQKMGDVDGAKEILEEVLKEGNDAQVSEAKNLIEALQH